MTAGPSVAKIHSSEKAVRFSFLYNRDYENRSDRRYEQNRNDCVERVPARDGPDEMVQIVREEQLPRIEKIGIEKNGDEFAEFRELLQYRGNYYPAERSQTHEGTGPQIEIKEEQRTDYEVFENVSAAEHPPADQIEAEYYDGEGKRHLFR